MKILLIRHGESQGNVNMTAHREMADHAIPLSDRGKEQARQAGAFIREYYRNKYEAEFRANKPPHIRIWLSPYLRTRQTAECILEEAGELITDVREHINLCEQQFGLFDGIPTSELPVLFPDLHAYYEKLVDFRGKFWARMPLGESRFDVSLRIHEAFGTFHRDNDKYGIHNIIVVCHGVTLRAFVMRWLHRSPEWFESEPNPANCAIRLLEDGQDKGYIYPPTASRG